MYAAKLIDNATEPTAAAPTTSDQIHAFLDGKSNGEELLHALYDYVLDEPIPPQMRELLEK
jgi:hypothetical protein